MRNQLPHIRAIHISAKDKCCVTYRFGQVKHCDPKHCKRTKNYFGKINDAIIELLKNYKTYTSDIIDEIAAKYSTENSTDFVNGILAQYVKEK